MGYQYIEGHWCHPYPRENQKEKRKNESGVPSQALFRKEKKRIVKYLAVILDQIKMCSC